MKQKIIVLTILIVIATSSSFLILRKDSSFNYENKNTDEVLAVEHSIVGQVAYANNTTAAKKQITKKTTTKKKVTTKKKTTKKKTTKKKSRVNLAPPVITPDTAPHSAKNKYN